MLDSPRMRVRQNLNGRCGKIDFSPGLDKVSGGKKKKVSGKGIKSRRQNTEVRRQNKSKSVTAVLSLIILTSDSCLLYSAFYSPS
jgi:hypothetical protein